MDLAIDFPQKKKVTTDTPNDLYFDAVFKHLRTEYLVDGDDGEYIKMVCETELDLSYET